MNRRHFAMLIGVLVAGWLAFFGDKTSTATIAEPVKRSAPVPSSALPSVASFAAQQPINVEKINVAQINLAQTNAGVQSGADQRVSTILALQDRDTFILDGQGAQHGSTLFSSKSWTPPPPPPSKNMLAPPPPPPPMAPPLPFTYIGKKIEDGVWEVYLARGEKTVIVRTQSVVDGVYQINVITPPTLSLTYLPLNQVQRLTIGGTD